MLTRKQVRVIDDEALAAMNEPPKPGSLRNALLDLLLAIIVSAEIYFFLSGLTA